MDLVATVNSFRESGRSVKLHVGCGSRLFDTYINVDGEYMSSDPNVAIHDLTKPFPLPDNSVDEILSVHVIEHIPRSQVPVMLKEYIGRAHV